MAVNSLKLDKLLQELNTKNTYTRANENYARGDNEYILNKKQEKKPDNRIPNPLAKVAVESMTGYGGRAGDKQVLYDKVDTKAPDPEDQFIEYMTAMDFYNDSDLENSEMYEESLIQGKAYEIFWTSDELNLDSGLLTTEFKIVPNQEVILKYNNNLKRELTFGVHFTKDGDGKELREEATVYYPFYHELWVRTAESKVWIQEELENPNYPFSTVPINVFKSNRRAMPLFQAEKPLIDAYDEILSKSLNEVDRFNAAIALLGAKVDQEFVAKFKAGLISVIDKLGEDEKSFTPSFMEKNLGGIDTFYNSLLERIESDFHKSVGVINWSDDVFSGSQSGLAMLIRLTVMEFKAAMIDTYFDQGLNRRLDFYGDVYNASTKSVDAGLYTTVIKSRRNIPIDTKASAEVAQLLAGVVSQQTLLENLGKAIVPDVDTELLRLEEEAASSPFLEMEEDIV